MRGVDLFETGVGAGLLGVFDGPLVTERLQARRRHLDSASVVLGARRANVAAVRAHQIPEEGEVGLEVRAYYALTERREAPRAIRSGSNKSLIECAFVHTRMPVIL